MVLDHTSATFGTAKRIVIDDRSRLPYRLLESAMRLPELPAHVRELVASGR